MKDPINHFLFLLILPSLVTILASHTPSMYPTADEPSTVDPLTEQRLRERWNALMNERTKPVRFDPTITSPDDIHVVMGRDLYLTCGMNKQLAGKLKISFIRLADLNLLSVGHKLHTPDPRVEVIHVQESANVWTLRVKNMQLNDTGQYECQINSQPKTIRKVFNVRVIESAIYILPSETVTYVNVGSDLALSCFVDTGPLLPQYITWYRGNHIVEYSQDVDARVSTSIMEAGELHRSQLMIMGVEEKDSGEYWCDSDLTEEARINVFVVTEDLKSLHLETAYNAAKEELEGGAEGAVSQTATETNVTNCAESLRESFAKGVTAILTVQILLKRVFHDIVA